MDQLNFKKLQAPNIFHSNTEARFPDSSLFIADNILIIKFYQINSNFNFQEINNNRKIIMVKGARSRVHS